MNRPMDKVCHIYDGFAQEWGRAYPNLAVPSLTSVCNVSLEGDRSCDNSASISDVRCSLKIVNDTIHKLNQDLDKQRLIKKFLVQILGVLTGGESAAVSVGEGKVVEKSARQKKDDTGFDPGLVSGQIDSTRVVKGNEEYSTHGLTCDCVSELDESCSLCAARGKVSSVKDAFDKLSGESFRFVSKIEVSGDRACPRQNQHRPRDHQQNYRNSWITSRHDATGVHPSGNDSSLNSAITRSNSVPDSDMFRKGKHNVASDEPVVRHKVGSKDNFLAVQAKHISPSELAKNFDSVSSSPKMNRHYQMLKLTHGFDVVLDSGTEGGDSNNKKSPAAGDSHNHGSTVVNPRSDNVSGKEAKISNRAESPSLIKASTRGMVSIITVENTKNTPIDTQGNSVVLPDSNLTLNTPPLDVIKQDETETSTGEHAINSTGSSLSRQSVKKAPVPPPVAKKPVKLSNSNQLSPSTAGPNPFTRVWDLSPDVHSPSYSLRNSVERKDSHSQSDVNRAVGDVKDSVSETVSSTRDSAESRKSESIKVTPPSPLVADFTSKYVDRQNSWPSELKEERTKGEVTTSDLAENSVAYREAKFVEGLSRPKSEEILAMRSFKPQIADDEQRKTKFGVDGLADNLRTSFGLVRAKFQDCDNLSERNSDSVKLVGKRSSTPPAPPPRLQVEKPEIKSVDGVGLGGHADAVRRMSSSTSTDTVTEFNRNMSLSSDFDVKEALSTLDTLLTSQGADDLDEAPVEKPKRYALKTPLYENWTINRAITSSFNQGDFDSISDDDELEGASISSAADSPSHKRHSSPTGSKDSGLCEETTADSSSYPDSVFDSEISSGRIRNLKVLQALELREEEASDQCDSLEEPPLNFVDYTDVEDRFVLFRFMHVSDGAVISYTYHSSGNTSYHGRDVTVMTHARDSINTLSA
ncbi:hypothetical protein BgiMline_028553 [Biomphalaria glabrata]|nr:hypothetical protein BgiMline_014349 [Biomphalaria glabrata]